MKCLSITLTLLTGTAFAWWQIETVDSTGTVGWNTSLALDSSGYPHISYADHSNADLKYAFWNGSSWEIEIVDKPGSLGLCTSLALNSAGYPHISYFDDSNADLKYAWQTETGIEGGSNYPLDLLPITPNPASCSFSVNFSISESAQVGLCIYDLSGRLVRQTPSTIYDSGLHQVNFSDLETGVYLCRMRSGDFTKTQQFVVID